MGLGGIIGKVIGTVAGVATGNPWIGTAIGAGLDWMGKERANSAAQSSSREQMEFQNMMSSTAYQRAVKDLEAAGLNKALAYSQGGASMGVGASYTPQNTLSAAPAMTAQVMQNLQLREAIANTAADTRNKQATTDKIIAETANVKANTAKTTADLSRKGVESRVWDAIGSIGDKVPGLSDYQRATRNTVRNLKQKGERVRRRIEFKYGGN